MSSQPQNDRREMPRLALSPQAQLTGVPDAATLADAGQRFRLDGCLQVNNALPADLVDDLSRHFAEGYSRYFGEGEHDDALTVGDRRYKVSVALEGPFNTPRLYANDLILPIVRDLLGDDAILASMVAVVALPGAPGQGLHRDHPWLFGQVIDRMIPCYALKLIVPLIDLDEDTGTTLMKPGSHVVFDDKGVGMASAEPAARRGDCLLMDYRLLHEGTANRSSRIRPVLFLSYTRPWFRDYENFRKQDRMVVSAEARDRIPACYRPLFPGWG